MSESPKETKISSASIVTATTASNLPQLVIKVRKSKCRVNLGPYLDQTKVLNLPDQFGPGPIHRVVRESVQKLVDASVDQKEVFGMLRQGEGRVIITASFEDKIQKVRLPNMESEIMVWDFFEILFEELRCEPFFESNLDSTSDSNSDSEDEPLKNGSSKNGSTHGANGSGSVLKRKSDVTLTCNTMPNLTAASSSDSGMSASKSPKIMDPSTFYSKKSSKMSSTLASSSASAAASQQFTSFQNQRPRGRPPGARNKVPPEAKANKSPKVSVTPPVSSSPSKSFSSPKVSKSGPIYQNAHKLHLAQEQAKQKATLVATTSTTTSAASTSSTTSSRISLEEQCPPKDDGILPQDPTLWSIDNVINYMSDLDSSLRPHVEMFRSHEIDGNALLLLTSEMMMKYMDMKLGPALKICNIVNKIQGKKHQPIPTQY
jgi:hypothetical protein